MFPNICETERGNTMLVGEDGAMVCWIHADDDGAKLEISYVPMNYPSLSVQTIHLTDDDIVSHINENCVGWTVVKNNLDSTIELNVDDDGEIFEVDEED